jgi:hypothetical protein
MKINMYNEEKDPILDFIAEGEDELPIAVSLAHKQARSFRDPIWCDKCKDYHTVGIFYKKHKEIPK